MLPDRIKKTDIYFWNVRKYTSILARRVQLFQVNSVYLMPKLQIYVVTSGGVWVYGPFATVSSLRPCASINLLFSQIYIVCFWATTTQSLYFPIFHNRQPKWQYKLPSLRSQLSVSVLLTTQSIFHIFHLIAKWQIYMKLLLSDFLWLFLSYYNPESVFSYFPLFTVKWQCKPPSLRFPLSVSVLLQPRVCIFLFSIIDNQQKMAV